MSHKFNRLIQKSFSIKEKPFILYGEKEAEEDFTETLASHEANLSLCF